MTTSTKKPKPAPATKPKSPAGLSTAGTALWDRLVKVFEFDVHEPAPARGRLPPGG